MERPRKEQMLMENHSDCNVENGLGEQDERQETKWKLSA